MSNNPLVAKGVPITGFVASAGKSRASAVVVAGSAKVQLSRRGSKVLAALMEASPEKVAAVEELLSDAGTQPGMLSPEDAAALLGVSRPTVVRWAASGQLTDHKVNAHHRFDRAEVLALRERRLGQARTARLTATAARESALARGVDLNQVPTSQEMAAAGRAMRDGNVEAAADVVLRARRSAARAAAEAAAQAAPAVSGS